MKTEHNFESLSHKERKVAECISWGATKKEIAVGMGISEHTVVAHTRNIYEKTGVQSVGQLSSRFFIWKYKIDAESPLETLRKVTPKIRKVVPAIVFLGCSVIATMNSDNDKMLRSGRVRASRTRTGSNRNSKGREYTWE